VVVKHKPEFDDLVTTHGNEIFAYLWRLLGNSDLAEDCLQDVFLRAFRAYGRLDGEANFRAWLYKIATNTAYSLRKREARITSRQVGLDITRIEDRHTPHDDYDLQERLDTVAKAVMSLPKMQRAAIMLRKYQELSYSEIASILDCSESSARANVYQGLKNLRSKLTHNAMNKVMR
jgi:RNA polymerase sigma-70 factor (ECF subfamily)